MIVALVVGYRHETAKIYLDLPSLLSSPLSLPPQACSPFVPSLSSVTTDHLSKTGRQILTVESSPPTAIIVSFCESKNERKKRGQLALRAPEQNERRETNRMERESVSPRCELPLRREADTGRSENRHSELGNDAMVT